MCQRVQRFTRPRLNIRIIGHLPSTSNVPECEPIMKNHSPKVDAYIARSADFAKPILKKIRTLFHKACPQIEETIKWGFPHFEYKGVVGSMAAFKQHVSFGFWKAKLMTDPHKLLDTPGK